MDLATSAMLADIQIKWKPTKDEIKSVKLMLAGTKPRAAMNLCGLKHESRSSRYRAVKNLAGFCYVYCKLLCTKNPNLTSPTHHNRQYQKEASKIVTREEKMESYCKQTAEFTTT